MKGNTYGFQLALCFFGTRVAFAIALLLCSVTFDVSYRGLLCTSVSFLVEVDGMYVLGSVSHFSSVLR